jgi:hypothetical protein
VFKEGEIREDGEISLAKMNEDDDLEDGIGIQVDKLNFIMIEQAAEEIMGRKSESTLEECFGDYDFISIGVGMSSSLASHQWRTARGGRKWSSTNLRISLSSMVDGMNISGCKAAMKAEKGILGD